MAAFFILAKKLKITERYPLVNKRLNKLIYPYHRTPLSKNKEWTIDINNSLDGSPEYYAETEKYSQPLTVINIFCMILFLLHS